MRCLITNNSDPLIFVSGGKFEKKKNFIHEKRRIDTFVIFICIKGPIFIAQDDKHFTLKENQYLILFADHDHAGYKESFSSISYYWCHFKVSRDDYRIVLQSELANQLKAEMNNTVSNFYILPEHGDLSGNARALLMFRQLLDISHGGVYTQNLPNYALSLLAMEVSQEFIESNFPKVVKKTINPKLEEIIEWIRINYNTPLSLEKIGKRFNYNSDYLSTNFRKYKGISLMKYILSVRITASKVLLLNSSDTIKEIAYKVGFADERVFMKRFKHLEDTTPTKYRNAFSHVKLVKTPHQSNSK